MTAIKDAAGNVFNTLPAVRNLKHSRSQMKVDLKNTSAEAGNTGNSPCPSKWLAEDSKEYLSWRGWCVVLTPVSCNDWLANQGGKNLIQKLTTTMTLLCSILTTKIKFYANTLPTDTYQSVLHQRMVRDRCGTTVDGIIFERLTAVFVVRFPKLQWRHCDPRASLIT